MGSDLLRPRALVSGPASFVGA